MLNPFKRIKADFPHRILLTTMYEIFEDISNTLADLLDANSMMKIANGAIYSTLSLIQSPYDKRYLEWKVKMA